jgi:hypothetical protein
MTDPDPDYIARVIVARASEVCDHAADYAVLQCSRR